MARAAESRTIRILAIGADTRAASRVACALAVASVALAPRAGGPQAAGSPPASAAGFTLEQVMAAPFPSALVAAPSGSGIAWVSDSAGVRNVWVASPLASAHRVTDYRADDGQEISEVRWLPGARGLVYVRGGAANAQGENPNPALLAGGVDQGLWMVSLTADLRAQGAPRRIGDGHGPAVSPSGARVAFVSKDQVWTAALDGHSPPVQLLHTRGQASDLHWSPDGSHLAFVSDRKTHAFVGVYDIAARTLLYLAPSVDRDQYPAWSPDSRRLAYVRIPAETRTSVFGARRSAQPWSVWIADVTTGVGSEAWRASPGPGSAFHPLDGELSGIGPDEAGAQLFWGADNHIVFPWERDGWSHLYAIESAGNPPTLLTPGNYEVEQAVMMHDGSALVITSNEGTSERRRLWRVAIAGGAPTPVTGPGTPDAEGDGIQWSPVPLSDGTGIALLHSGARLPARPAVVTVGSVPRDLAPAALPTAFPASALVEPQVVTFPAADGLTLHGELFLPPADAGDHGTAGRHPAVVFFHGGSRRQMLVGWHYMQYYANAYAMNQYLASRGYVVLAVNYRSGVGYGMEFREALNYGATGGSEYNDVQGAGIYLRGRSDVDPSRIAAWGGSYGGYLTALALARASDLYAAGVDFHGVHDWNLEFDALVPGWDTERDLEARKLAYESSPMSSLATWRSPVLLIQGDDDRSVAFNQTVELTEDLRARGVHVEQLIFPDEAHDFLTHTHWLQAYHATAAFLDRTLSGTAGPRPTATDASGGR